MVEYLIGKNLLIILAEYRFSGAAEHVSKTMSNN